MKKSMLIMSVVLAVAIVSQARADFVENFDSYADGDLLTAAPWSSPLVAVYPPTVPPTYNSWPMTVIDTNGYGGTNGAHPNGPNWYRADRASGQTSATEDIVLSLKARLSDTANAIGRLTWSMFSGATALTWEMDAAGLALGCPIMNAVPPVWTSVPFVRGPWYECKVTINQVADTVTTEWGTVGGTLAVVDGPKALPSGFVLDTISIGGIYCFDEGDYVTSAMDDVSLTTVPEPVTMSLLAIGGLLAIRRRR